MKRYEILDAKTDTRLLNKPILARNRKEAGYLAREAIRSEFHGHDRPFRVRAL